MMDINNIIEVRGLVKNYKKVKAVRGIDFNVKRGDFFAFLGLNGAGKSTTINILCSIIKKDAGEILIDGISTDKESEKIKSKIGIVFQKSVLDNELTVLQNLYSRASLYPMSREEAEEKINNLIEVLNLQSIIKRQYGKLSGGQRRKVDIARALLHNPQILFLDEPTTGLDPNTRITVWEALNDLKKKTDLTIFLTTHYMEEVVKADHVVIIDEGIISASGSPDELKSRYTSDILRIITNESEEVNKILTEESLDFAYRSGAYEVTIPKPLRAIKIIEKHSPFFDDFEVLKGNMDHVFLNVTGKKIDDSHEKDPGI
ncbi:MAG: ABC transporter ATP-binding protein [Bacilli bacterium]|jgi:ABC-type multidrug transport system ATPase subunit